MAGVSPAPLHSISLVILEPHVPANVCYTNSRYSDDDVAADQLWAEDMDKYRSLRMEISRKEAHDAGMTQVCYGVKESRDRRRCRDWQSVGE